jgi:hypothetical protein
MIRKATKHDQFPTPVGMITFREAGEIVAASTGRRAPHISAVHRWRSRGLRGRQLKAQRIGGTWFTRIEWLREFLDVDSAPSTTEQSVEARQAVAAMLGKPWGDEQ